MEAASVDGTVGELLHAEPGWVPAGKPRGCKRDSGRCLQGSLTKVEAAQGASPGLGSR